MKNKKKNKEKQIEKLIQSIEKWGDPNGDKKVKLAKLRGEQ